MTKSMPLTYHVYIDDNFHFMDASERYSSGDFATFDEAVSKCKAVVDEFLVSAYMPKDTAESLYMSWLVYGEDPFITGSTERSFSASAYAKVRCSEMCG